jgi:hypothetical protein
MNQKISHTNVDLTKQGDNSNLGNLLADYTLKELMYGQRKILQKM